MSSHIPKVMRAAVLRQPGGPEVLSVEEVPVPVPHKGEVLIKIMAAGMNRSEMFTRQGGSDRLRLVFTRSLLRLLGSTLR
jgi:NADPH:quinone reductase-like Zn-dependent oxidoreductase